MEIKNLFIYCFILAIQSCTSDYTKDLGKGYFYRFEGSNVRDILCERSIGKEIPSTVLDYAYNDDFIIANQKPKNIQDPLYKREYIYYNGKNTLYFWIIIKEKDIIFGPMDKSKFIAKAKELGVNLKFEKNYPE